ncbi:hypothetical protein KJS94_02420 [Flavihumibacter rivuli]|uniref:hypothetical protein n=1 Tax=Flavihumibacter rivuli TaxID=2838156 RepID=UPI001BDF6BD4|nr:hypothetical protein [Flavihumibacter rivuli]ULQ57051.1 hypothetical protein KJS94_02420 [Flavihumibacter rivuli]
MKTRVTIFFLLLFTLAQTELHQLVKLPVLVEHFREHRKADPGISLVDFLVLHYKAQQNPDSDYQKDRQLPFKTADCLTAISFVFETPFSIEVKREVAEFKQEFYIRHQNFAADQCPGSIFQPPRQA